ncbi:iron ABC transporter permease [Paenibacillus sp. BR2-3]|uniref:FecCD family ABC transporter permease n=1 Tax=Paenibacillus sp. BR2-3 TaxID=3048494 RepID=UPI00397729BE
MKLIVNPRQPVLSRPSTPWWVIALALLLLLFMISIISTALGAVRLSIRDILHVWLGGELEQTQQIIMEMRMPRVLIAVLVGGALAMSGAIFQAITRNNLASPDIIGVSNGAGLMAVILIVLFPAAPPGVLPIFAFIGGATAALAIYLLTWRNGIEPNKLIMMGIAISALCLAAREAVVLKAPDDLETALFWLVGSVWGQGSERLISILPWFLSLFTLALVITRPLAVLQLGDKVARGLGSKVELIRLLASVIGVGLAGCAIAVAGNIGFVGLLGPHIARLLVGPDVRRVLPVAALIGAIVTVSADTLGRIVLAPAELPAGLLTALIGAPYFLWLLYRER